MNQFQEDKLFWDGVFSDALRLSVGLVGICANTAKECAKVADEALKARRKTFKEEPVTA